MNSRTAIITTRMIAGYTSAPRILLSIAASCSSWSARRLRAISRVPDFSPAWISARYTPLNTCGCWEKASKRLLPASAEAKISSPTARIARFSVCSVTVRSAAERGRPAPIKVDNWRVNIIRSFLVMRVPILASGLTVPSSTRVSGIKPWSTKRRPANCSLSAWILPLTILPVAFSLAR